ncbi:hypothetical protein GL409_04740 [Salmonella enterica]|nr:hypothetical protein [Salmonella enterica]
MITFEDSVTNARTLLLSSSCSGDRQKELTFRYEGSPASAINTRVVPAITGQPTAPSGWTAGLGTVRAGDEATILDLNGVNVWTKDGVSSGETVTVKVTETGDTSQLLPGYYTATYCVQQVVS